MRPIVAHIAQAFASVRRAYAIKRAVVWRAVERTLLRRTHTDIIGVTVALGRERAGKRR